MKTGMKIGRYETREELGGGAMGVVYRAYDPNFEMEVALKVLRPELISSESYVHRFLGEAMTLVRLEHPHIVRVFNVDRAGDTVFIAMELIEGEPLTSLMKRRRFSAEEIAAFGAAAAEALHYANQKKVVHRDVKPGNILFRPDGSFKITDFGIAHIEDPCAQEKTQTGEILGTPPYMSPEQVRACHVDGRSDLFSLGIVLYELAAGVRPFRGQNREEIFAAIIGKEPAPLPVSSELPKSLCDVIMRCLSKVPEERYASGGELAAALRAAMGLAGSVAQVNAERVREEAARPATLAKSAGSGEEVEARERAVGDDADRTRRRRLLYALLTLAALAASALGFFLLQPHPEPPPPPSITEPARSAWLTVDSTPQGAEVYVDGSLKGMAPMRLEAKPGKHEVRLTLPRHDDWEAQVELKEQADTPISVRLHPASPR